MSGHTEPCFASGISFPPHWLSPGEGEQAAWKASERFRSSSIDPRHLPLERLGLWGFNVCQGLQLPPIHMPGVGKKSLDLLHEPFICSHRHHCSIHTTYRCVCTPMFLYILETHTTQNTHAHFIKMYTYRDIIVCLGTPIDTCVCPHTNH